MEALASHQVRTIGRVGRHGGQAQLIISRGTLVAGVRIAPNSSAVPKGSSDLHIPAGVPEMIPQLASGFEFRREWRL